MSVSARAIEVVNLMVRPQTAAQVHDLSEELQAIQASPEGWQAADVMLSHEEPSVRFYGALTLQIKLNKQGRKLAPEAATEILNRILIWMVQLASRGEQKFVLDKLCSTLTTYFVQSPVKWRKAIRQVVCSLYAERVVSTDEVDNFPSTEQLIRDVSPEKQLVAIRFCQTLAEDMLNWAVMPQQQSHLGETFKANTAEAALILGACLTSSVGAHILIQNEALSCFTVWVSYAHNTWSSDIVTLGIVQDITPRAAEHLLSRVDELREPATDLFVNILEYRRKFLKPEHMQYISQLVRTQIGPQCVAACNSGHQEPEIITMGRLVAAYGKSAIKDIVAVRKHSSSQEIVELFQNLLTGSGYPAENDELILSATEFWNDYSEHVVDILMECDSDSVSSWLPPIRDDLMKALGSYMLRLAPPPSGHLETWEEETFSQWKMFRANVGDFLESVTNIPDTRLLHHMGTYAMQVLANRQWLKFEAVLYCINQVSDSVNIADEGEALNTIMGSSMFGDVSDSSTVPVTVRRGVVQLIDGYSPFIRQNPSYIPPILTFLFTVLASTSAKDYKVADAAAKSFESLCSYCRRALIQHLDELHQQCPRALSGPSSNSYQKEKVMSALASIIQALPTEEAKATPLLSLIQLIEIDLNTAVNLIQSGDVEQGENLGTETLQCLASIAKGIQAPDEVIELDSDNEDNSSGAKPILAPRSATFWTQEAGSPIQARILAYFDIIKYISNPGDAIDAVCACLKAGLSETEPGPFVFPPSAVVAFISKAQLSTPRVETILSTACTFIAANSRRNCPHLFDEVLAVYQAVSRVVAELGDPSNDPQLAQLCVDFLARLLHSYLDVLLAPSDEDIAAMFNFNIACLTGEAPMLKRSVCSFFETLIGLARPNSPGRPLPTRVPIATVVIHFSPVLADALISQISGAAQRSELDSMCKPLRSFIFAIPNAKRYLEDALSGVASDGGSSGSSADMEDVEADDGEDDSGVRVRGSRGGVSGRGGVSETDKRVFLKKIIALRGGKQTNAVVREFWAKCKGTVSRYE